MTAELARAGGVLAAAGLAALVLAPGRWTRLAGLAAWALGGSLLLVHLVPTGRTALLAAAVAGGLAAAAVLAAAFVRWPWLVAVAALAAAPARVPVELGGEDANLLLPLYGVVAAAALALAWSLARGDERARELGLLAWPVAGFVAWTGLSLAWTDDLREGAVALAAFYLPFALLAVVVSRLPWDRRWVTALLAQLVAMAVVFAAVGVYQWVTRDVFWNPKVIVGNAYAPFYRVNSVFWDPSIYGRFLVVAILALLVVVLWRSRWRVVAAGTAALAFVWAGLVFSFSQSSFAALVAALLAAGAFVWGRRGVVALGLVAVALVAVGFAAPQVRAEIERDFDRVTGGRAGLVANGIRIAAEHPALGVGVGSFERAYAERTGIRGDEPGRAASHTTPVTVAAETGVVGLALWALLVFAVLFVAFGNASWSFAGRASLIVGLAVLAIAVHSLAYAAFVEDPLTWGLVGLAAVVARRGPEDAG